MEPKNKTDRTIRGFLTGQEPDEEPVFHYSATLRIFGEKLDFEDITSHLGKAPTRIHRKDERKGVDSPVFKQDYWLYCPPIEKGRKFHEHIDALWADIKHAKGYLLSLKKVASVEVALTHRSNVCLSGVEIPYESLEMFKELEVPFGMSIVIA